MYVHTIEQSNSQIKCRQNRKTNHKSDKLNGLFIRLMFWLKWFFSLFILIPFSRTERNVLVGRDMTRREKKLNQFTAQNDFIGEAQ